MLHVPVPLEPSPFRPKEAPRERFLDATIVVAGRGDGTEIPAPDAAKRPALFERSFVDAPPEFERRARRAVRAASLAVAP
ncbi:MAG: hypothetical protein AAFP86_10790, partial [Planctomycetota bacterium]